LEGTEWLPPQWQINTDNSAFLSSDHGQTSELDTFDKFLDFSRCTGSSSSDVAALGDLSGIDLPGLDLPASHEQFVFTEDVTPAFQDGFGSSHQSFLSPGDSLSTSSLNTPSKSNLNCFNQLNDRLPLVVTSYKCPHTQCGALFKSEADRRKHSATKHPVKSYNCGLLGCDKSFSDQRSLERHLNKTRKHQTSNTLVYTCRCSASQPRWDKFNEHIRRCRVEKTISSKYTCHCGQEFQDFAELGAHKAVNHPDKQRGRPRKRRALLGEESL